MKVFSNPNPIAILKNHLEKSHLCALPVVRNVLDRVKATCMFFLNSPKHNEHLAEVRTANVLEPGRRKPLINLFIIDLFIYYSIYARLAGQKGNQHFSTSIIVIGSSLHSKSLDWDCTGTN